MIDIVVPFYNDSDNSWKNIMYNYMAKENSNDRQVIGDERYRHWECFKYWFRCVEKNCKWVNKVFLLVANKTQVPKWLNTKNPKLRIVLHEEFIPKELLPTFNTFTIEVFINKIKDLSDNYVYCNDDFYFLNYTNAEMFFINDIPVFTDKKQKFEKFGAWWLESSDGTFYSILNNGMDLQYEICGDKAHWYALDHIPIAHKKNFESEIVEQLNIYCNQNSASLSFIWDAEQDEIVLTDVFINNISMNKLYYDKLFEVARKFKGIYKFKVLKAVNGASYYIYLSHCIFIYLFDYVIIHKIADLTSHPSIVRWAFVYIASILFSVLLVNIKKRIKKHA